MKDLKNKTAFSFSKKIPWVLAFLLATGAGIYFRTYALHHDNTLRPDKLMASLVVEKLMVEQLQKSLDASMPATSADDKLKMAREQARRMILSDRSGYDETVADTLIRLKDQLPQMSGRRYLLEADPYYYYFLTQQIIQNGKISNQAKGGQYYNPLMHAPYGYWTSNTWHPYVGFGIAKIVRWIKPSAEWMEALSWVPVVLSVIACLSLLFLAKALALDALQFLIGALTLMLSPIFAQRSGLGWYDTDPYNYIFPFTILAFVLIGLKNAKWTFRCALASGFLTGLYALFWTGWPFIFLLMPATLLAAYVIVRFALRVHANACQGYLKYFAFHSLSSLLFAALFLTPKGLIGQVQQGWEILMKFALSDVDVWPNIFLTVGEARGTSIKRLIYLSGNYITFAVATFGLLWSGLRAWAEQKPEALLKWFFLFIFSVPLFLMPLKTERFGILFVISLSIWAMYGVRELESQFDTLTKRFGSKFLDWDRFRKYIFGGLLLIIFLPLPLVTAHVVSLGVKPIMDDAWYDTMQDLKTKTRPDAIVNSWWPPGYFVVALANRRVIADGGTQHLQETYWLSKILASQDEREAAGLLRMLNHSGNDALLFLKAFGMETMDAVHFILAVVPVSRDEALTRLPKKMPDPIKNKFLDLTHGKKLSPSYVLVYSDMIEQNLAVTMVSRWNFKKAKEIKLRGTKNGKRANYAQDFVQMTDGLLKYTPAVDLGKKEGDVLYFSNGLAINLKLMDAVIQIPEKRIQGRPASLFYMKDGQLEEKMFEGERLDTSALLISMGEGRYRAVLADARLIRSMMFRMYYLKGEGLKYFKPFSAHRNPLNGNEVAAFELQSESIEDEKTETVTV